ncbi:hypothetical protein CPB86DRAFT_871814 [Serendipita vermifera]|nr:hypothetical protein CPB86DRAFT_871814 [Serendipita vermifera]
MKLEIYAQALNNAQKRKNVRELATLLSYNDGRHCDQLWQEYRGTTRDVLTKRYNGALASPWDEICIAHLMVILQRKNTDHEEAYKEQALLVNAFLRWFNNQAKWVLDALYLLLQELRDVAHEGDVMLYNAGKATACCEDAARICNKAFTLCVTDRTSPPQDSRKWGVYRCVNIVLKCYFKVNRTNLSKNVLRAIEANPDIPLLEQFSMADQVTYHYYQGLLALLDENYSKSESELTFAFENCHWTSPRNQERILTFLIPLRMMKGTFPSAALLARFEALEGLYGPFLKAIRTGDVVAFDQALTDLEARLVQLNVWLIIVKVREVVISRVFKKSWVALGKPPRMNIAAFHAALKVAGEDMPVAEAECLVANSIYKGYIKGYISHETQLVVLAKTDAFPRLSSRTQKMGL